jgi:hypothetical protein
LPAKKVEIRSRNIDVPAPEKKSESGTSMFRRPEKKSGSGTSMFRRPEKKSGSRTSMFRRPEKKSGSGTSMFRGKKGTIIGAYMPNCSK